MYFFIIIWWVSSSIFSSYNRIILRNSKEVCLPLKLTLYECVLTCVVEYAISKRTKINLQPACGILTLINTALGNIMAVYSTVHFSQMLKFAEPIIILFVTSIFFKESVEKKKIMFSFIILLGSFIYSTETNINEYAILAVCSSALRSILLKRRMTTEDVSDVLFDTFLTSTILCLGFLIAYECTLTWNIQLSVIVFSFVIYNMVSNRILKVIDTSLHSVGKVGKRVVTILLSLILVKEYLSIKQSVGLFIMTVGMYLFIRIKKNTLPVTSK